MAWQYHPLIILFFLGGLIALGVAGFCLQYIRRHGGSYLVVAIGLFGLHNAIWAVAAALKTANTDLATKVLFYKLQFLGSTVTPSLTIVIALTFVGWDRWLTPKTLATLTAVPVVAIPLVIINPAQVMITDPVIIEAQGIRALEHSFSPLFALLLAWGLGAATLSAGLIAYAAASGTVPKKPAAVAVFTFLLPVGTIALKVGGLYPPDGTGINVTPAVNAIALGALAVAIARYRFFELLPIGRTQAVEIMADGYVLVGPNETILDINPAARNLLMSDADESLRHTSIRDVVPVYDDLAAAKGSETAVFQQDGHTIEVRRSMLRRQHQAAGCLLLLRDITERQERKRELERANESLEQFASVVAHDLRNPLNVAQGNLDIARESGDSEPLATASSALDRMDVLITDVLTLARQGQPISETERVTLASVASSSWAVVDSSDATLTVEGDLTFLADADRLQQLLENLFRNAIDHGGSDVTIRVGALDDGSGVYVADDGPGIPAEKREAVFESGYSTDAEGTGFGLAIVEEIVEAHGWQIRVTDAVDGGARFEITGVKPVE